jgi:hypothetical protein
LEKDWRNKEKNNWYTLIKEKKWRKSSKGNVSSLLLTVIRKIENSRHTIPWRIKKGQCIDQLHCAEAASGGKTKDPRSNILKQKGGSQVD